MGGVSSVPSALETAIQNAAAKYGVPADLLEGIWRVESGSTYPNPAKNSSGYGGLFGTTDAYGSTQEQANLSASILAAGLRASGGNIAEALSYYNSGHLTGGYTSVPGETTFGNISAPTHVAAPATTMSATQTTTPPPNGWPKAGTPFSQISPSMVKTIENALLNGSVSGTQVNGWYPGSNVHGGGYPWSGITGSIDSVGKFFSFVTSWRFAEIVSGAMLLLLGLFLVGKQFGVVSPVNLPVVG